MPRNEDDILLESRIHSNQLHYPKGILGVVAAVVAFQPVFISHSLLGMEWSVLPNPLLFIVVSILTAYMLQKAYVVMIESEFWGRQRHFTEVKDSQDERALRQIRLQRSMGYALFFLNTGFFLLDTLCLCCLFHQMDPRAKYIISPLLSSALLWMVTQKNEESRQKRLRLHK